MGPFALWHVGSSQTRAETRVPCIGRQILNHCATREAPPVLLSHVPIVNAQIHQATLSTFALVMYFSLLRSDSKSIIGPSFSLLSSFFKKFILFLFLAALGLHCCARALSGCAERGLLFVAVRRLLIAEHGL